ncbi:MFS transporter [Streptosporangium amethystogenes]|uniref:MFS transporter n=1 Tax=Streptosporangium amethystogenes TaxID=2002 RepID=UPI0004C55999|nr:MFS transporter [Streptosporangium amethystogenes]
MTADTTPPDISGARSDDGARIATVRRRTLAVLSTAQISGGIGVAVGLTFSSVTVKELSGSTTLSGLAGTATVLGAALLALPTARSSDRGGRRAGLTLAYGCALLGCLVSLLAVAMGSWPLLLAGLVLFGAASAGNLASRYAATDLSAPGHSARHLSLVVWATTIGAVTGPNLAGPAERFSAGLGLAAGSGPFALALLSFAITLGVITLALRPDPLLLARSASPLPDDTALDGAVPEAASPAPGERPDPGRQSTTPHGPDPTPHSPLAAASEKGVGTFRAAWRVLRTTPLARRALAAIAVSHTAMVSIMSMTPVHLDHGGSTYTVIGIVISLHIAGMYVLSPVVGWLADRAGRTPVLVLGMGLLLVSAVLTGGAGTHDVTRITAGLILLGLGWSCGLIAGSAMLSEAVPLAHRTPVQGLSDLLTNLCGATGTVAAGVIVGSLSYGVLGAAVGGMVTITGAWLALSRP